eukprot:gene17305-23614_t
MPSVSKATLLLIDDFGRSKRPVNGNGAETRGVLCFKVPPHLVEMPLWMRWRLHSSVRVMVERAARRRRGRGRGDMGASPKRDRAAPE